MLALWRGPATMSLLASELTLASTMSRMSWQLVEITNRQLGGGKKHSSNGPSLFELYRCYHHGHGCTQDDLEARKYLQQAADEGYGPAYAVLSKWYCSGWENVLRKNAEKQAYWSKQATISSEKHPFPIYMHPLRSLLGTNATPAWWKSLRTVVDLMEPSGGGTKSESKVSAEADDTLTHGSLEQRNLSCK